MGVVFFCSGEYGVFRWNLFWVEMTQHNYSLELIIRGTAPSSVYISISCRSESSNKSLVVLDNMDDMNSLGNNVVTIDNGAIVGKDVVDESLDLVPTCFQNLLQKWISEERE